MTSLNPVLTIGTQIAENVVRHWGVGWRAARERAREMLELVRIADAERRLDEYPHQLSGGMRQRVMIAMALSCDPQVLIADEPTTALDVTIQAQILDLMLELKEKLGTAIVLITHDLGVSPRRRSASSSCMPAARSRRRRSRRCSRGPLHPYTRGLLRAIPRLDLDADEAGRRPRLAEIPGIVPVLTQADPRLRLRAALRALRASAARAEAAAADRAGAGHIVGLLGTDRVREAAA